MQPKSTITNPRIALYARVSTEDQAERQTVQAQLDFLRRFADLHGIPVAGEYIDDGISGAVELGKRPEGRRLLTDAAAGLFGAVLVYRLDRLGRSLSALLTAHDALDAAGVAIRSGTEPFDTSNPIGRFVFQLLGSIAELERETIKERMSMGRDRVARDGRHTGGQIPLGYTLDPDRRLVPSDQLVPQLGITEADLVRDLFRRIIAGSSASGEARRLSALGVQPQFRYSTGARPTGRPEWGVATTTKIIKNPVYKGTYTLRSRRGTVECEAPALVDAETWEAAGAALIRNRNLSRKPGTRAYLLRGIIRCGNCGSGYAGRTIGSGASPKEYPFYVCNGGKAVMHPLAEHRCRGRAVNANKVEAVVWQDCRAFILNPGEALAEAQAQLAQRRTRTANLAGERRRLLEQLSEKETERDRVLTLFRRGLATLTETERQLEALARETATLRELIESVRAEEALAEVQEAQIAEAGAVLARLGDRLVRIEEAADTEAKRQIVEMLVQRVTVTTDFTGDRKLATVNVVYRFTERAPTFALDNSRVLPQSNGAGTPGPSWG